MPKLKSATFKYGILKRFVETEFKKDLRQIPYHVTEIFDDINDSYWLWSKLTMEIVEEHAPLKTRTVKGYRVPYMNGEFHRAINVKNRIKGSMIESKLRTTG